ncbi:MAG: class I SAM-dependent methyltransferase [Thermoplasmatota archaeon]
MRARGLPHELCDALPTKWEKLGDVVLVKLPLALEPYKREVAAVYAEALGAKCVLADRGGVAGEYREMAAEILFGSESTTVHREHGIRYALDAARLMFASGNVEERRRAGEIDARGETVVDMFAGIGYFAVPLAKTSGATRVVACEKNPVAFEYLVKNRDLNGVAANLAPVFGDNRDLPLDGEADRVFMGYVGRTREFLPKALALLKPGGGIVHYHDTFAADSWRDDALAVLAATGRAFEVRVARVVKSYAPRVVHVVIEARFGRA